jgi:hypothetical protein
MTKTLTALMFATAALAAGAQTPAAPAAATPAAAPAGPKHACTKPEYPGRLATTQRQKGFERDLEAYKKCIMGFVDEQRKAAEAAIEIQKGHVAAGNAAIAEYNDHIKALNTEAGTADKSDSSGSAPAKPSKSY